MYVIFISALSIILSLLCLPSQCLLWTNGSLRWPIRDDGFVWRPVWNDGLGLYGMMGLCGGL